MLREPVSFMHALHAQFVNETTEDEPDFARALAKEPARRAGREIPPRVRCPSFLHYRERARYAPQLERYFAAFPREAGARARLRGVPRGQRGAGTGSVLEFLGVDPGARAGLPRGARSQGAAQRPPEPGAQLAAPEAGRVPRPRPEALRPGEQAGRRDGDAARRRQRGSRRSSRRSSARSCGPTSRAPPSSWGAISRRSGATSAAARAARRARRPRTRARPRRQPSGTTRRPPARGA